MFVGCHGMKVKDEDKDISFPVLVMYPTETPSNLNNFGPYTIDVSPDAPIAIGEYPLVIVSHGGGGSHLVYRTITTHLAKNGYIVAMLEHHRNNRNNNELEDTYENLVNRPKHVRITIDEICSNSMFSRCIQPNNAAIIGHSMGGYTALAVAGGKPWANPKQKVDVMPEPDSRIRALVLLAPATAFYQPDNALRNVTIPILLLVGEHDSITPKWQADLVLDRIPDRSQVTYRVIENADHFSFLSPFPSHMRNASFLPSTDPEGFDRDKFHEQLPVEVLEYLDERLK